MKKKQSSEQQKIGSFIRTLRESRGITQGAFAQALGTSQSAVARMEKGEQNFTTGALEKISKILDHKVVAINSSIDFEIRGGRKLSGTIRTNYSKNGSVGLLCAALLNRGKTILHGIARIEEVYRVIEILESIGTTIKWIEKNTVEITPPKKPNLKKLDAEAAIKTRSILMTIGPLIHLLPSLSIPHAQGCHLGKRTIAAHQYGLEELGIKIEVTQHNYLITAPRKIANTVIMYEAGDTAAENVLMAAAKIPGTTTIQFTSANYMVQEMCFFLEKCGVQIDGIGTSTLIVHGVADINTTIEYHNSEDPIESMTFIAAAIATDSTLTISHVPIDFLTLELYKLGKMGLKYKIGKQYTSANGRTNLTNVTIYPSKLVALDDKIHSNPYPGVNMDNLPYFVIPAIKAKGQTLIHDWVYENRAIYLTELNRLGAHITLADPHRLYIDGGTPLKAAQIVCPPALRPSVVIMIAMLAAPGTSILRNVYMINRGFENITERLNEVGADITVLTER
ncbi:MAG: UDP-N-acetylglucosamine 1-carboxyvinyltransferase [Candidatus Pacebacteria bacterium]|jgi:UDP-N-acetylglucosamine 1-carboxyvinyltransferase|nr:UDP-N-acetylglucosamine 1-carboxyvinyltransferase [Candidatus Paceibacterota bacterium]